MFRKLIIISFMLISLFSVFAFAEEEKKPTFSMTTNAFLDKMSLPVLYTCDGKNESPQLEWTLVTPKATSLVLIMTDPDAPTQPFYHWIVFNIPPTVKKLDQGISKMPSGVLVGKNSFGNEKYDGPCPPKGTAHTYIFTLYALDTKLDLQAGVEGKKVEEAMKDHIIEKTELTAVYSRWL